MAIRSFIPPDRRACGTSVMFAIDSRRRATENELKHYLTQIDATNNWDETREKVWRDCSLLGPAGTNEKEKAIQDLLEQKGVAL